MIKRFSPHDPDAWLAAIVESSDDAIVSKDLNGIIKSWNAGAQRIFGYTPEEMIGQSVLKLIPPDRYSEEEHIIGMVKKGERVAHYETLRRCKDGRLLNVSLTVSPIMDADRNIIGASKIARDITETKIVQETQALLLRELNHRSKNLLAVADAILRQTAKSTGAAELVNRVSRRFQALSVNQDLLIEQNWRGAELSQIIRSQLAPLMDDYSSQISIEGPNFVVSPTAAQALAMAIFELGANAVKFGALTSPTGRIEVRWSTQTADNVRQLKMTWREMGGPAITQPRKKAFGTTIIESMVARSLQGQVQLNYPSTGLTWELVAPESALLDYSGNLPP